MKTDTRFHTTESAVPVPTRRQALEQAKRSPGFRGICRFCGCTDARACEISKRLTCQWFDPQHTVCSMAKCVQAYKAECKPGQFLAMVQQWIADDAAKSLIDSNCGTVMTWLDTRDASCDLTRELTYLDLRGILERKTGEPHMVRFHG